MRCCRGCGVQHGLAGMWVVPIVFWWGGGGGGDSEPEVGWKDWRVVAFGGVLGVLNGVLEAWCRGRTVVAVGSFGTWSGNGKRSVSMSYQNVEARELVAA